MENKCKFILQLVFYMEDRNLFFKECKHSLSIANFIWCLTFYSEDIDAVKKHFLYVCQENTNSNGSYNKEIAELLIEIVKRDKTYSLDVCLTEFENGQIAIEVMDSIDCIYKNESLRRFLNKFDYLASIKKTEELINLYQLNKSSPRFSIPPLLISMYPVIIYSLKTKVGFGLMKGFLVEEILKAKPNLILHYVNNLKHFIIDATVLTHPTLVKFLNTNYLNFTIHSIIKSRVSLTYMDNYRFLTEEIYEDDEHTDSNRGNSDVYYWAYEIFPQNENEF